MMNKPSKTGIARIVAATGYSIKGLKAAWKNEEAFRLEATIATALFPLCFWLGDSLSHKLILIISLVIVLIAELVNSAIEATIDRIGEEIHPLSGQAKDIGSATVFISMLLFALIWAMSLWDYFTHTVL